MELFRRHPVFTRVFAADMLAQCGEVTLWVAFPLFVLALTGDVTVSGTVIAGEIVAFGLLSPLAGNVADTRDPRTVMRAAAVVRMVLLGLLLATAGNPLPFKGYLLLALALGAAGAFFVPARAAFVRRLLDGPELEEAVALSGTGAFLIRLFAPALMGAWLAVFPVASGVCLDLLAYVGVLLLLAPAWVRPPAVGVTVEEGSDWREGWRLLLGSRVLRRLAGLDVVLTFMALAAFTSLLALLEGLGLPAHYNGWLIAANGLAGAVATRGARFLPTSTATFAGLTFLMGLSCLGVEQVSGLLGLMGLWLLRGAAVGVLVVKLEQQLALAAPPAAMGRLQAAWSVICCFAAFFGSACAPLLLRTVGTPRCFTLYGVALVGAAVVFLATRPR